MESKATANAEVLIYEKNIENACTTDSNAESAALQVELVDFDGLSDPANPHNWSKFRKWTIVILISLMSLMT